MVQIHSPRPPLFQRITTEYLLFPSNVLEYFRYAKTCRGAVTRECGRAWADLHIKEEPQCFLKHAS